MSAGDRGWDDLLRRSRLLRPCRDGREAWTITEATVWLLRVTAAASATIRADLARSGFGEANIEPLNLASHASSVRDAAIGIVRGTSLSAEITIRDPVGSTAP